jgi:hypothetical protein
VQSFLATASRIVINQTNQRIAARRGGMLVALLYRELARRSRRGGAVPPTTSYKTRCTIINNAVCAVCCMLHAACRMPYAVCRMSDEVCGLHHCESRHGGHYGPTIRGNQTSSKMP